MSLRAKDVMSKEFDTIRFDAPIAEAVTLTFRGKMRATGHRTVSVMVADDFGRLSGMISMFDVLYHFRPNFLNFGFETITDWMGKTRGWRVAGVSR